MTPSVCCLLLTADRAEMTARAVRSFRSQTYVNKWLVIYDTSMNLADFQLEWNEVYIRDVFGPTIGELRNHAIATMRNVDIIAHFDSDDWSAPERLTEQVALLQSSGAACVGYRDAIFYDTTEGQFAGAWRYTAGKKDFCLGASLCYWRRVWEAKPFPKINKGEDYFWQASLVRQPASSIGEEPRLLCGLHGSNTSSRVRPNAKEWQRAPQWDAWARERWEKG